MLRSGRDEPFAQIVVQDIKKLRPITLRLLEKNSSGIGGMLTGQAIDLLTRFDPETGFYFRCSFRWTS